jgi:anti-sigma factor RsiW
MKCRRAKTLISDFIDGMISDQDRVALEAHLTACESCEGMAASLSKSLDLLHSIPQVQPSENFNWKVRLGIAQARNAIAADAAGERARLRSWNIRFALSAVATFVVVASSGYFILRSSIVPGSKRFVSTPVATAESDAGADVQNRPVERRAGGRSAFDLFNPNAPIVAEPVTTNNGRSKRAVGNPLIEDVPLNIDSLTSHFLRSRAHEVRAQYRMRLLEEQIKALQGELKECEAQDE